MQLPVFWRRASFSVAEAADLVGVTEETLRTWLARNTVNDFNGCKTGSRLYLSGQDAFYYALVSALTGFGVGVRVAMLSATQHANDASDELPDYAFLVVRREGGSTNFLLTNSPEFAGATALVIPIRRIAADLIERAAVVYAAEEGSSPHKIGTINGVPAAQWIAAVEAELERMPVNR